MKTTETLKFDISDGDMVWVESPYGKVKAKAKFTEGIYPEAVGLQHGFGHWALGELAKERGTGRMEIRRFLVQQKYRK